MQDHGRAVIYESGEPFPGYSEAYLPANLAQEETLNYEDETTNQHQDDVIRYSISFLVNCYVGAWNNIANFFINQCSLYSKQLPYYRNKNPECVQFWQYGDLTYPVSLLPEMQFIEQPIPFPTPNFMTAAHTTHIHQTNNLVPPVINEQPKFIPQLFQECMFPPPFSPFLQYPTPQVFLHGNPVLHGNYNYFPLQENQSYAPSAQINVPFPAPSFIPKFNEHIYSYKSANNSSIPNHQPQGFRLGSIDCDTFLIENRITGVSGYASIAFRECALSHPLGNITKTKRAVHCHFILNSGIQW